MGLYVLELLDYRLGALLVGETSFERGSAIRCIRTLQSFTVRRFSEPLDYRLLIHT